MPYTTSPVRAIRSLAAGVAAVVLVTGGCGDSGSDAGVASVDGDAAGAGQDESSEQATEEEMIEYTECLRDQGIDIEDPVVDADGNVSLGDVNAEDASRGDFRERMEQVTEACGEPPGGGFAGDVDRSEREDMLLQLAQCLRDQGLDVSDPDFSGEGPAFGDEVDPTSPEFEAAMDECGDIVDDLDLPGRQG